MMISFVVAWDQEPISQMRVAGVVRSQRSE
jgi:hypothetical protein